MENGRENATQLSTMIFYIARNPFSNLNISCLLYFKGKPIFSALLTHLRRLKQANIGNRFHVLVKITRPAFTKARLGEYNLQPNGKLSKVFCFP